MRFIATFATIVVSSTAAPPCAIGAQANVKLDPKDQAVLIALGKALNAPKLLNGAPVAALFSTPSSLLTLNAPDGRTLSQALVRLRKVTACYADRVTTPRILEDDTPGIRFLRQIEGCLADACVDNQ